MVVLQNERLGVVDLGAVVTHRLSVGRFANRVREIDRWLKENFLNAC
jgi:hypothetical protein